MRKYLIALSAIAVVATTPAAAKDLSVNYQDLNLRSDKGQKELQRRIDVAAREYCGIDSRRVGTRVRSQGMRNCYHDARNAAREQMDALITRNQLGG